jgi:hypothetical protein
VRRCTHPIFLTLRERGVDEQPLLAWPRVASKTKMCFVLRFAIDAKMIGGGGHKLVAVLISLVVLCISPISVRGLSPCLIPPLESCASPFG